MNVLPPMAENLGLNTAGTALHVVMVYRLSVRQRQVLFYLLQPSHKS